MSWLGNRGIGTLHPVPLHANNCVWRLPQCSCVNVCPLDYRPHPGWETGTSGLCMKQPYVVVSVFQDCPNAHVCPLDYWPRHGWEIGQFGPVHQIPLYTSDLGLRLPQCSYVPPGLPATSWLGNREIWACVSNTHESMSTCGWCQPELWAIALSLPVCKWCKKLYRICAGMLCH